MGQEILNPLFLLLLYISGADPGILEGGGGGGGVLTEVKVIYKTAKRIEFKIIHTYQLLVYIDELKINFSTVYIIVS